MQKEDKRHTYMNLRRCKFDCARASWAQIYTERCVVGAQEWYLYVTPVMHC